jgi:hypothetical protein
VRVDERALGAAEDGEVKEHIYGGAGYLIWGCIIAARLLRAII